MTSNPNRSKAHRKLAGLPGVRSLRRPVTTGSAEYFDLYYVRTGPLTAHPIVIIPGGPGLGSVQVYKGLRKHAADLGLDVLMIEHRGVGMSRHDDAGADLPPEALTVDQAVDDIAAVLDEVGIDKAIIYGTSYGTYLAAGLGVRHPDRVHAMILDSPVLSARDFEAVRGAVRDVLLDGELAPKIRQLIDAGLMTPTASQVATISYGFGGTQLLDRQLDLLLDGHTLLWRALAQIDKMTLRKVPYRNEIDLVGRIAFRELDYVGQPDGLPLDPSAAMLKMADHISGTTPDFEGEPYDLVAEMPHFRWPTVVISGLRDLITPPTVADRVAALIPDATVVRLPTAAHSALDTRERAALRIAKAVVRDQIDALASQSDELDSLPPNPALRLALAAIDAAAKVEAVIPSLKRPTS